MGGGVGRGGVDTPPPKAKFSRKDLIFGRFRCRLDSCQNMSSQLLLSAENGHFEILVFFPEKILK